MDDRGKSPQYAVSPPPQVLPPQHAASVHHAAMLEHRLFSPIATAEEVETQNILEKLHNSKVNIQPLHGSQQHSRLTAFQRNAIAGGDAPIMQPQPLQPQPLQPHVNGNYLNRQSQRITVNLVLSSVPHVFHQSV